MRSFLAALLFCSAVAVPAAAAPAAKPADLAGAVAKRLASRLGVPVKIGELVYRLFQGTFVVGNLRIGPAGAPFLSLGSAEIRLASIRNRRHLSSLEASNARARVPLAWLTRRIRRRLPATEALSLNDLRLDKARVVVVDGARRALSVEGLSVRGSGLKVSSARVGQLPKASGQLRIKARRAQLGAIEASDIEIVARLDAHGLTVELLEAKILGGKVSLSGRVPLRGLVIGRINLRGNARVQPQGKGSPRWAGSVTLGGTLRGGVRLRGRLHRVGGSGKVTPAKGSAPKAPKLRLDVRLGKRHRLRGTLARWTLR
ncbi:MAG: hypothetical protein KC503_07535 [Myxococcales bacterium]|nr:hypothetical protein [Myxococcales bacterium]